LLTGKLHKIWVLKCSCIKKLKLNLEREFYLSYNNSDIGRCFTKIRIRDPNFEIEKGLYFIIIIIMLLSNKHPYMFVTRKKNNKKTTSTKTKNNVNKISQFIMNKFISKYLEYSDFVKPVIKLRMKSTLYWNVL
jgi:hypothetical protein